MYLSSRVLIEDAEYGKLCGQRFTRSGRRPEQHIMICVIHCMKDLRLDWIEMREPERYSTILYEEMVWRKIEYLYGHLGEF